jgi:Holliday junction resolvase
MNANQKGKRFEREVAKLLNKKFNTNVRRTPMSGGMSIKGDIIDINPDSVLYDYHFECKNQEKLNIWKALEQARSDRPMGKTPLVVFTKNFESNYVAIELDDFMNILKELEEFKNQS